ncbi:hypothetical protein [Vibrio algicola]|uniref:Uncharacterized protein n=1 Tax=Vibrio algicola TaxID=2662262 RepID=A0A5Q0THH9_9VIBR|nr:hypothetical protein [Vibrio algicola]
MEFKDRYYCPYCRLEMRSGEVRARHVDPDEAWMDRCCEYGVGDKGVMPTLITATEQAKRSIKDLTAKKNATNKKLRECKRWVLDNELK